MPRINHLLWFSIVLGILLPDRAIADGIAVISHADIAPYRAAIDGFHQQINLPMEEYHLGKEADDTLRAAINQQRPDLIFVLGKSALRFARTMQREIPTVVTFVLHPGILHANESGIAMTIPPKLQLKTLLAMTAAIKTIGAVYDPSKSSDFLAQIQRAADKQNIQLMTIPVTTHSAAAQATNTLMPQVDAMWIIPDTTVLTPTIFRQMVRLSWQYATPLIGLAPKHVRAGCLFALSFDSNAVGKQAARLAQRILHATALPKTEAPKLESPETNRLSINIRTVAKLGIVINPRILRQADQTYPAREGERSR